MRQAHWKKKRFSTVVCRWDGYMWNFRGKIVLSKHVTCPKCRKTTILEDALLSRRLKKNED